MLQQTAVYITWEELFKEIPTHEEIFAVIREFNRQSTVVLLARLAGHLFLDEFRRIPSETIDLQSFLVSNFLDDHILDQAKKVMPNERLDYRRPFHTQQILNFLKWAILYALAVGGSQPDSDADARFALGRALLKTNDLLLTQRMKDEIAHDRKSQSARRYLRIQLSVGAGNEVSNPPPVVNAVARSATIFEEIAKRIATPVDLSQQLEKQTGISLDTYVDLTLGALTNYLWRSPKELITDSAFGTINPRMYFGNAVPAETIQKFWEMESSTIEQLANSISVPSNLASHQDFTAFRIRPFLQLDTGAVVCVNPGFIQEKLEIGLFWTIVNNLHGEDRQNAFETWGKLFEAYVNQSFASAVDPTKERYISRPDFLGKKHQHEAFDGLLLAGRICAVFECKGGFLPSGAKYADDLDQFVKSLEQKFATEPGAGVEQLVRKIAQVFAANEKERRQVADVDLSAVEVVVPVLVVQDNFVSAFPTVPWLAKSFRDQMRKRMPLRKVVLTSLLVLHVEDVETICTYIKARKVLLGESLLYVGKMGDPGPGRLFAFADMLRQYLLEQKIGKVVSGELDTKFRGVINRLSIRLFNREFEPIDPAPPET
jgi:hypothetical protein